MLLPVVSLRHRGPHDDTEDRDKHGKRRRRGRLAKWLKSVRSQLLRVPRSTRWQRVVVLGILGIVSLGSSVLLGLEVVGQLHFRGYFVSPRSSHGQLGFYHEMDVDMTVLKDVTARPEGKLFPASASDPKVVQAWVAGRRQRTNGRKFLVGCTSHWKGYVLRSFLSLFQELKTEHGWEELDTATNPMERLFQRDDDRAPSVVLFCLNSFSYPMALLQQYRVSFQQLRALGTILAVWNDDLHYYDQFDPIALRDEILTTVDILLGTYTYLMDDYFATVTTRMNERDLPVTVWLPHSSSLDFVNASFNEYPINKILLSGKLGSNWYPLRHWLGRYQQTHEDIMDVYHHTGYYVAANQSAIYASYLRSYRTGITTTLIFQYVIAKLFEIPSTGALLAVNRDVAPLLAALGMHESKHYVAFDRQDPETIITWVSDPRNWPEIDRIRRAGMECVRQQHLVTHRVHALDVFFEHGVTVYDIPRTLRLASPCPSKAMPDTLQCHRHFKREAFYKCDYWFCGLAAVWGRLNHKSR